MDGFVRFVCAYRWQVGALQLGFLRLQKVKAARDCSGCSWIVFGHSWGSFLIKLLHRASSCPDIQAVNVFVQVLHAFISSRVLSEACRKLAGTTLITNFEPTHAFTAL
jgi:hypothetical protein